MSYSRGSEWKRWDLHLHTASSYDYKYQGDNPDQLLCQALKDNDIAAVAITDHFKIDADRIKNLRTIAPDIVFFPGVELRTNEGAPNIHIILIFSELDDLDSLSQDFESQMIRKHNKNNYDPATVFWELKQILEFAKDHKALVSVHSGTKERGLDKEIEDNTAIGKAIKNYYYSSIDFIEIKHPKSINYIQNYLNNNQNPIEKPFIRGSDNHNPQTYASEWNNGFLWIKANPTFEGLRQCLHHPKDRVYIGSKPPSLKRIEAKPRFTIDRISVQRSETPVFSDANWFNVDIPLNHELVAIIGNKGSGKSALADIIGHICKSQNMKDASFLNKDKFRKGSPSYAKDYSGQVIWLDGEADTANTLDADNSSFSIEKVQYLPQKHIEIVCTNLGNEFQNEIDKVIYSYVDPAEKGDAEDLRSLISLKAATENHIIEELKNSIKNINEEIVQLEAHRTDSKKIEFETKLKERKEVLERHIKSEPKKIEEPKSTQSPEEQEKLKQIDGKLIELNETLTITRNKLTRTNTLINELKPFKEKYLSLKEQVSRLNQEASELLSKHELHETLSIVINLPTDTLNAILERANREKFALEKLAFDSEGSTSLQAQIIEVQKEKDLLINKGNMQEKAYHDYLKSYKTWMQEKLSIEGDQSDPQYKNSIKYYDLCIFYPNLDTQSDLCG